MTAPKGRTYDRTVPYEQISRSPLLPAGRSKYASQRANLQGINTSVNRRIRPRSDDQGTDVWTVGAAEGDCDDYAVEKRKELLDRSWPSAALSLSVDYLRSGEAHLFLTVRTDRGEFALDNLRSRTVAADRAGYRFVARQSTIHPRLWVQVDGISNDAIVIVKAPVAEPVQVATVEDQSVAPLEITSVAVPAEGASSATTTAEATVEMPSIAPAGETTPDLFTVGTIRTFETFVLRTSMIDE